MRIAYFDCSSGISGDMILASLIDAGLRISVLEKELARLAVSGYRLKVSRTMRSGIGAAQFECVINKKKAKHAHARNLKEILRIIEASGLKPVVKHNARDIFVRLGEAEAKVHRVKLEDVHFHEVGNIDSIVDIVGACIALDALGIGALYASMISVARPAPATLHLLKRLPTKVENIDFEIATPTGVAILATLSKGFGKVPPFNPSSVGIGAGQASFRERPNILRVMIGEPVERFTEDEIAIIETNIDDMNPQVFEYLYERLFKEGALDVFVTPIQMKKSRPGFQLTVLAYEHLLQNISKVIFSETSTIGLRYYRAGRFKLERTVRRVATRFGPVRVKKSEGPGGIIVATPEYDDCARIARKTKTPFKVVYDEAMKEGASI